MYLREALKSEPAKNVVMGLTQTSENYNEALRCLQKRYDRPRVLHQAHVCKIQEAFPLKLAVVKNYVDYMTSCHSI